MKQKNAKPYLFEVDIIICFTKQVSLWPSFVVGGLFLLLAFPLLGFLFGDSAGSTGSG